MDLEMDWRHYLGAAVLILGLVFAGWKILNRPPTSPTAKAPPGANSRVSDAPETTAPGTQAPPGLPTAH